MIDKIYEKVLALIEQVDGLKYIDLQMGQLEVENPAVNFPCALIDVVLPNCEDIGGKRQQCDGRIEIMLAFKTSVDETASIYPKQRRENNLEYFRIVNDIYAILQGYFDKEVDRLSRKSLYTDLRKGGYKTVTMPFDTSFQDWSAAE